MPDFWGEKQCLNTDLCILTGKVLKIRVVILTCFKFDAALFN